MDVIEVENLAKYYGEFLAVDHISFRVKKGEIFGFLGPNGAGKTTTIRMLTGILKPSEGRIRIFGLDARKDILRIKENIGVVPEMANPYIDLTAMQNLSLVGRLYGMRKGEIKERSEELLHLFGIYERRDKKVRSFSKGLRQRLSLAMALLPDPELLFLDEPTSGLDVMSARLIKKIIRDENRKGKTIFMSTHNMSDANELCSRIAIINHGKIIAIDTPEKIKSMCKGHA
ncbi:MAG: ATP-binding cassette domain-containing protein, partial [Thermoplasmata archaeon]|nr:ATP-binding cassette domain-containing protein [Thermoplasmata archaeon]